MHSKGVFSKLGSKFQKCCTKEVYLDLSKFILRGKNVNNFKTSKQKFVFILPKDLYTLFLTLSTLFLSLLLFPAFYPLMALIITWHATDLSIVCSLPHENINFLRTGIFLFICTTYGSLLRSQRYQSMNESNQTPIFYNRTIIIQIKMVRAMEGKMEGGEEL